MTSKKELIKKISQIEQKIEKEGTHPSEEMSDELWEIIQPPIGFKNGLPPGNNLGGLGPEELQEFIEYRKSFLSEEDLSIAPQDWETYLYKLYRENKKPESEKNEEMMDEGQDERRLSLITKRLRDNGQFSIEKLQRKAEEEGIDSLLVTKWLDEEGIFLNEFKKENNLQNGKGPKGIQKLRLLQFHEIKR